MEKIGKGMTHGNILEEIEQRVPNECQTRGAKKQRFFYQHFRQCREFIK